MALETTNNGKPKAYINWILLNEQFKLVSSGFEQVQSNSGATHLHIKPNLTINTNGYLYIYTSNETENIAVYFDNLQVTHTRGALLEETHYYPFGLTMAGISSKAAGMVENKRKWNAGSELESNEFSDGSGLELYSTFYRSLDPQLGRFWQIDPKPTDDQSLYSSMLNNPIRFNDPLGDTIPINLITGEASFDKVDKANVSTVKNDGVFAVYAHANAQGIQYTQNGKKELAVDGASVSQVLCKESKEWKAAIKDGTKITLVIYGCNAASNSYYDDHFTNSTKVTETTIAQKLSTFLSSKNENSTVKAGNGYGNFNSSTQKFMGFRQSLSAKVPNTGKGSWLTFKNGVKILTQIYASNGTAPKVGEKKKVP